MKEKVSTEEKKYHVSPVSAEGQLYLTEYLNESPSERYSDKMITFKSKSDYKYDKDIMTLKTIQMQLLANDRKSPYLSNTMGARSHYEISKRDSSS